METKRPTVPAAEEILGLYCPVLDHGFVALIDYMGTDDSIERAARVSYGYGTRKQSQTRGLIRYLRRHLHTTPSEMVEFKFHCAMPIFVARQWIRHRTACLAEGTEIYFDLPGGIRRRGNQLYKLSIEEIWQRFQPTRNHTRPDRQRNPFFKRDRLRAMRLRQANEETLQIQHTHIRDVFRNGPKPVFRMVLADGKQIEATADHRFMFSDGWQTLREAVGLHEKANKAVWNSGDHYVHVNGTDVSVPPIHRDKEWLAARYLDDSARIDEMATEAGVSYHTIRKWLRIHGLQKSYRWAAGHRPWNKGKRYELGPRELSDSWVRSNLRARSGTASNFWRGGKSTDREGIGRWTTQRAVKIHRRNGWTCQLCLRRARELHCHHVVPVWADPKLARDEGNLTTLCAECHREISGKELEVVERLGGTAARTSWEPRPRRPWNKLTVTKLVRIDRFEYAGVKETYDLEVEGPNHNFVANGIVTHNSVNEYSGRYSLMPLLFYRPEQTQVAVQSGANRQGRQVEGVSDDVYRLAVERWEEARAAAADAYEWLLAEDVARELARIDLPLSTYTQWYWKIDLHNLIHFLTLRVDPHSQWEIQQFGRVMAGMLKRVAPLSYEAWIDYQVCGRRLSHGELEALRRLLEVRDRSLAARAEADPLGPEELAELGLSKREVRELLEKLEPMERPDFELDLGDLRVPEEFEERMARAVPGDFE